MKNPLRIVAIFVWLSAMTSASAGESPAPPQPRELGANVNPFIGTGGVSYLCGNVFPGATTPFGMVRLNPDTISNSGARATNMSGYYYHDDRLLGFSHTRLSGTGAVDGGNFLVMPGVGPGTAKDRRRGLNAKLDHRQETAFPGYYRIALSDLGVTAELTATRRVGLHRYTFDAGVAPRLLIDVTSVLGKGHSEEGQLRILLEAREIEGSVRTFGTFAKRYGGLKTYFVARIDQPFSSHGVWSGDTFQENETSAGGTDIGVSLNFPQTAERSVVEVKLGLSYVSIEQARANLEAEAGKASFDQVLKKAIAAWEETLSRIKVTGGTEKDRRIFYTALYHSFSMPTAFSDVGGTYLGFDGKVHEAQGYTFYTDMSLWDTFRTTHPLFNLIARQEQRDFLVSLVEMAKQGGYLPRWPSGNGYTNSMFGTPADFVVAESYLKGIRDFDVHTAYDAMKKTALGPTVNSRFSGRAGIADCVKYKYCPHDLMDQSVARTLEYAYADAALARLAQALGMDDDAKLFTERAGYYRHVWNPDTQYFHARDSQGTFSPDFDPLMLTYVDFQKKYTRAYVEGSALQWRWAVPHDPDGLIGLFKDRDYFVSELNDFFAKSVPHVGVVPNAYYWQGNQPDLFAAFLFNSAGRPDLTQKWTRWILAKKYGDQPNGLDGNDDGGTLSAWYVFASLGLFPVAGTDRYELCSPLWSKAEINLGGQTLVILAEQASAKHQYVRRVTLNGKTLDRWQLTHEELAGGGVLEFDLTDAAEFNKR